jgi:hypothetical protein
MAPRARFQRAEGADAQSVVRGVVGDGASNLRAASRAGLRAAAATTCVRLVPRAKGTPRRRHGALSERRAAHPRGGHGLAPPCLPRQELTLVRCSGILTWSRMVDLRGRPVLVIDVGQHQPSDRDAALAALLDSLDAAVASSRNGEVCVIFDLRNYRHAAAAARARSAATRAARAHARSARLRVQRACVRSALVRGGLTRDFACGTPQPRERRLQDCGDHGESAAGAQHASSSFPALLLRRLARRWPDC